MNKKTAPHIYSIPRILIIDGCLREDVFNKTETKLYIEGVSAIVKAPL